MLFAFFVFLFSLPFVVLSNSDELERFERLNLPPSSKGPYSVAFENSLSHDFVTGIRDGRIIKFNKHTNSFQDYATTGPRPKERCDGIDLPRPDCGRPLGVAFDQKTGELYVTDQFRDFVKVGPNGGVATPIASTADGIPLALSNAITYDQSAGKLYFVQASTTRTPISRRPLDEALEALPPGDRTGRLLKYDPKTQQLTVLLDDLEGASGVEVSHNGKYALVSEYSAKRIRKVHLGDYSKPFPNEVFLEGLEGRPFSIKRHIGNYFYIALSDIRIVEGPGPGPRPPRIEITPKVIKIDGDHGKILNKYDLSAFYPNTTVTEFQKHINEFYTGSLQAPFVGRFDD